MLRSEGVDPISTASFKKRLINDCRHGLAALLPFTATEMEFLDRLLDKRRNQPRIIDRRFGFQDRIRRHPLLEWKALNVREFSKKSIARQQIYVSENE